MAPRSAQTAIQPKARVPITPNARVVMPVRMAAWLAGDLGRCLERSLRAGLRGLGDLQVSRLPRGFLVESSEAPGPLLEAVHRAATGLEQDVAAAFPVFHHEMGPVWTGTLQAVFGPE